MHSKQNGDKRYLGLIEGFYGAPWSWENRAYFARYLAEHGHSFYIYAPKGDPILRRRWQENWAADELGQLKKFRLLLKEHGIEFGVGLSPFELYTDYNEERRRMLCEKVRSIDAELSPEIFAVLFDDMKGDVASLVSGQVAIMDDVTKTSRSKRFVMCPTYYSLDPILEKLFGIMPEDYTSSLGKALDPAIDIFWTGPQICSPEYPIEHLEWVTNTLRRKPFIWDNYPVNDGEKMSPFLHLRPFTGRGPVFNELIAGHGVNPMKQARLSAIPLASLAPEYQAEVEREPTSVFRKTAVECCGEMLGPMIVNDIVYFQDRGLNDLVEAEKTLLARRYAPYATTPCGAEILAWLRGEFVFDPKVFHE